MTERWRAALDDNKTVGALFIDFRKAFDTISHELLPLKLQAVGIMGDSHNWILDYLKDRSQFTTVNGSSTKPIIRSPTRFLTGTKAVLNLCK